MRLDREKYDVLNSKRPPVRVRRQFINAALRRAPWRRRFVDEVQAVCAERRQVGTARQQGNLIAGRCQACGDRRADTAGADHADPHLRARPTAGLPENSSSNRRRSQPGATISMNE